MTNPASLIPDPPHRVDHDGECMFFEVSHDSVGFGVSLGDLGCGDEGIRVPEAGAVDGRGRLAAHLAEIVSLRFGVVEHGPCESPVAGDVAGIVAPEPSMSIFGTVAVSRG